MLCHNAAIFLPHSPAGRLARFLSLLARPEAPYS